MQSVAGGLGGGGVVVLSEEHRTRMLPSSDLVVSLLGSS